VEERTAELVCAKERAEAASQARSQFLVNMSHELRTPMHAILSFARLGREKFAANSTPPSRIVHYFERIEQSGQRLLNQVNDLLDLSRLESGRMTYDPKPARLDSIVREVIQELSPMLAQKDLRLNMKFPDTPTQLNCDPLRISQVFRNLLANAIKFTPEGRGIHIAVEPEQVPGRRHDDKPQAGWRLTVSDDGLGIPENELEAVFDSTNSCKAA
jgi:signal transduction histidine kinase